MARIGNFLVVLLIFVAIALGIDDSDYNTVQVDDDYETFEKVGDTLYDDSPESFESPLESPSKNFKLSRYDNGVAKNVKKIKKNVEWLRNNFGKLIKSLNKPKQPMRTTPKKPLLSTTQTTRRSIQPTVSTPLPSTNEYRLPNSLTPYHYDILTRVQFTKNDGNRFPYTGTTTIYLSCNENTRTLKFHMNNLDIDRSSLVLKGLTTSFTELKGFPWVYDSKTQIFTANLSQELRKGNNYSVTINYTGYLQDDNAGFYRSSYIDDSGNKRWLLASQMEPIDARKSFPCFDEPSLKATFKQSVIHPNDYHALSNMPITRTSTVNANEMRTEFDTTPRMSTYLVALVVSDFVCVNGTSNAGLNNGNVAVRVCARPNAKNQIQYALDVAIKVMNYFRIVYDIEFPLPKSDHVALPDFAFGAMENWGIITYREARLLYAEGVSSQSVQTDVAAVIAHELSHMWFGDYVTPKWWDDIWLNEGFARYMQYVGTAQLKPEWFMYDQLLSHLFDIMQLDSVSSSHPISVDVNKPDEINEIFDDISYGKAAAVIQMANYFLANQTFRQGITQYLSSKNYSNAEEDDLWNFLYASALKDARRIPANLSAIMHTWTRQMGYPVVDVKTTSSKNQLELTQKHFLLNPEIPPSGFSAYNYKWYVPFTYSIGKVGQRSTELMQANANNLFNKIQWLLANETKKTINLGKQLANDEFIIANLDGMGYFRVNYDENNWNNIIKQLNLDKSLIPLRHRAQIINDAFSIAQAGDLSIEKAFEIIKYLPNESEYLPWITTISRLRYLTDMIESTTAYSNLQEYLRQLISPIYKNLGWEPNKDDSWLQRLLRTSIIRFACDREVPECIKEAQNRYAEWMQQADKNNISPGVRSIVYCTAIRYGGDKEWRFAADQYVKETDSNHKNELQSGMSCATQPHLLLQFLNNQLNDKIVRRQDTVTGLRAAASRATGNAMTWQFVKDNWKEIFSRYGGAASFASIFTSISSKLNTQNKYDDFEGFLSQPGIETGTATREIKLSKDKIKTNIRWMNKNYAMLNKWLSDNIKPVETSKPTDVRLPTNLTPFLYELQIQPYIGDEFGAKSFRFDGEMKIHFTCVKPTNQIIFHIRDLDILYDTLKLTSPNDDIQLQSNWENDFAREFFKLNFTKSCKANTNYTLYLRYEGPISDSLRGFYRSSYIERNTGMRKYLATTDFEPTDARSAFPCFDEPAMKAVFRLTIIRHKNFSSSFSNMPHLEFNKPYTRDWFRDTFQDSKPMSTYLVAYVIANFKNISKISSKGHMVEVVARPEAIDAGEGNHALQEASSIIDFFSDYFNVSYPLPKSTQLGVPDFNSGAMENWGLITYRETQLLYNPKSDALSTKRRVSVVVSHELSHQWFGNLVTPQWWNDLWLNEGFASWVEYLGYNYTHPEWRDLDSFFTQTMVSVLGKDSLENSHPISADVKNPDDIISLFDTISYNKGASVIRMMDSFLTEQSFKKGLTRYLNKYRYGNANQDNLWEQLTIQAHSDGTLDKSLTVKDIMDTWTTQKGYPVVTVTRDYNKNEVKLKQEWFLLNPNNDIPQSVKDKQKWYVGFSHTTRKERNFDFHAPVVWLKPSEIEKVLKTNANNDDWIIGNLQHAGFYRVNYDEKNWNLLIKQLKDDHLQLNEISRAQLLDDSFNLGRAEVVPQTVFLDIVKYLKDEDDPIPWSAALSGLSYLSQMLASETYTYSYFKKFYANLLRHFYDSYGWDDTITDAATIDLQLTAMSAQCGFDNEDCMNKAKDYFIDWKEYNKEIPANFKNIVYQTAIRYGSEDDWHYVFERAKMTTQPNEQIRLFGALASTKEYGLLRFLLSQTKDGGAIRPQDAATIINAVAGNGGGRTLAWNFMVENWDLLIERYGGASFTLPNLVTSILRRFNSEFEYKQVEEFRSKYQSVLGVTTGAFKESLETIKININWMKKNSKSVIEWLQSNPTI